MIFLDNGFQLFSALHPTCVRVPARSKAHPLPPHPAPTRLSCACFSGRPAGCTHATPPGSGNNGPLVAPWGTHAVVAPDVTPLIPPPTLGSPKASLKLWEIPNPPDPLLPDPSQALAGCSTLCHRSQTVPLLSASTGASLIGHGTPPPLGPPPFLHLLPTLIGKPYWDRKHYLMVLGGFPGWEHESPQLL